MSNKNYIQHRTDSLNHYLNQIECHHPLTQEEEQELGRRILSGDTSARDELIEANLRFVLKCALEMQTPYVPIDELIAAGNYGLTIAATRFDPSYDNRFCTYAVHYIRNSIREAVRNWMCQLSMPDPLQGLQACLSLDDTYDEDKENWSHDLIDRLPAPLTSSDGHRMAEETKEHLHSLLSKWYYPSDVQLLMDWAQMMYDGYTISDLAKKYGLPIKRIKKVIGDLQQKAKLHQLQQAFQKAA